MLTRFLKFLLIALLLTVVFVWVHLLGRLGELDRWHEEQDGLSPHQLSHSIGFPERVPSSVKKESKTTQSGGDQGQCRAVTELLPPALPISPYQVTGNMSSVVTAFRQAMTQDVIKNAVAWMQLAMPNTGSTSMEGYMALGSNMTPLMRSGGCSHACVTRIGPTLIPAAISGLAATMGFSSAQLQDCGAELFWRLSSVVRCPHSGSHFDYTETVQHVRHCFPGMNRRHSLEAVTIGTTIRNPIQYHYKDFRIGHPKVGFDVGICQLWENLTSSGPVGQDNTTFGFACERNGRFGELGISSDFQSYVRFAHHRWNIFTRNLAGTLAPQHISISLFKDSLNMHRKDFTRPKAIEQNKLGVDAPDYKTAIKNLEAMPHFSIFERMPESIELLCFTYCYNCTALGFTYKPKTRKHVPDDVAEVAGKYHRLDLLLYEHANRLLSRRISWMREAKAKGVQCDILISGCGLICKD